jgi:hypothetical protein
LRQANRPLRRETNINKYFKLKKLAAKSGVNEEGANVTKEVGEHYRRTEPYQNRLIRIDGGFCLDPIHFVH